VLRALGGDHMAMGRFASVCCMGLPLQILK
jgi:hypothetical protein